MGSQVGEKDFQEKNVFDATLDRMRDIFKRADNVTLGFSGGKDSTVCLHMALTVAREMNRLPLEVHFFDEEVVSPETEDYVRRVSKMEGVDLKWWCVPIQHRNGCSRSEPYWYPWDEKKKDKWCRPLPEEALTLKDMPGFLLTYNPYTHTTLPTINHLIAKPSQGMNVHLMGLRSDESIRRYQSVARSTKDNFYSTYFMPQFKEDGSIKMIQSANGRTGMTMKPCPWIQLSSPIYDWSDKDVWRIVNKFGLDYNRTYDRYRLLGIAPARQRVAPPYGEQPMQSLYTFKEVWPELWDKVGERVEGAKAAAMYSRTELYSYGKKPKRNKAIYPMPMDFIIYLVKKHPRREQKKIVQSIKWLISLHAKQTKNKPIPEDEYDPRTGVSWSLLYMIALRGDLKDRAYNLAVTNARIKSGSRIKAPRKQSTSIKRRGSNGKSNRNG